jgi:hypothetical protein
VKRSIERQVSTMMRSPVQRTKSTDFSGRPIEISEGGILLTCAEKESNNLGLRRRKDSPETDAGPGSGRNPNTSHSISPFDVKDIETTLR